MGSRLQESFTRTTRMWCKPWQRVSSWWGAMPAALHAGSLSWNPVRWPCDLLPLLLLLAVSPAGSLCPIAVNQVGGP